MKKVRVGIVGLGRLGLSHAEHLKFHIANADLVAACSIVEREREAVQKWEVPYVFENYEDMISSKEAALDAVVIATPSGLHCEQAAKAMDAGLHVFCEKPLGVDVAQCKIAEAAVERHPELVFMIGFMRRFDPSYAHAKELIDRGDIGKPIMIKATSMDPNSMIDSFLPFAPTSGGIFRDLAIHDIDLARWFLDGDDVESIYAAGNCYLYPEMAEYGDVDNACAIMKFKRGGIAMFTSSRTAPHGSQIETEIIGTKGILRVAAIPEKNLLTIYQPVGAVRECYVDFRERWAVAYLNELTAFVECIAGNRKPDITVYDGTKCTEISYAAMDALHTNQIITLP